MLWFVVRRVLLMVPALLVISALVFAVVQLQPGGFLTQYLDDPRFSPETVETIKRQFGLDQPAHVQYLRWLQGIVTRGDFGYSFLNGRPVGSLIWERVGWTVFLALLTIAGTWLIAIPLGIYTALRPRGPAATLVNLISYLGQAMPDFLLALLLIALVLSRGGTNVGGLFSPDYIGAPWSWGRLRDMLAHLWIPLAAISLEGVAGLMRQMRAKLLDVGRRLRPHRTRERRAGTDRRVEARRAQRHQSADQPGRAQPPEPDQQHHPGLDRLEPADDRSVPL